MKTGLRKSQILIKKTKKKKNQQTVITTEAREAKSPIDSDEVKSGAIGWRADRGNSA
jgi:hypothetical protein